MSFCTRSNSKLFFAHSRLILIVDDGERKVGGQGGEHTADEGLEKGDLDEALGAVDEGRNGEGRDERLPGTHFSLLRLARIRRVWRGKFGEGEDGAV
jgi:hypothetical protein